MKVLVPRGEYEKYSKLFKKYHAEFALGCCHTIYRSNSYTLSNFISARFCFLWRRVANIGTIQHINFIIQYVKFSIGHGTFERVYLDSIFFTLYIYFNICRCSNNVESVGYNYVFFTSDIDVCVCK